MLNENGRNDTLKFEGEEIDHKLKELFHLNLYVLLEFRREFLLLDRMVQRKGGKLKLRKTLNEGMLGVDGFKSGKFDFEAALQALKNGLDHHEEGSDG